MGKNICSLMGIYAFKEFFNDKYSYVIVSHFLKGKWEKEENCTIWFIWKKDTGFFNYCSVHISFPSYFLFQLLVSIIRKIWKFV